MSDCPNKLSRRKMIKFFALGASFPIMSGFIVQAQATKVSKESMQYRDEPNENAKCSNCMQFIPGDKPEANGQCKVVEGSISPQGWCNAYAKKS